MRTTTPVKPLKDAKCLSCGSKMISIEYNKGVQEAVNAHERLIQALELCRQALEFAPDYGRYGKEAYETATALLAEPEGGK